MKFINSTHFFTIAVFLIAAFSCRHRMPIQQTPFKGNAYYLTSEGNDAATGLKDQPWKSIEKLNGIRLKPGDTVFFDGSQTFRGSLLFDSADAGTKENPVIITSFGNGNAIINGGDLTALTINKAAYLKIHQLHFIGSGRKNGNTQDGVA
ncbi:MAG: hypothetical protein WKF70_00380, partial [Chitinophagaceae bacterium]